MRYELPEDSQELQSHTASAVVNGLSCLHPVAGEQALFQSSSLNRLIVRGLSQAIVHDIQHESRLLVLMLLQLQH